MSKILFATDLDNTLIHSYKTKENDDICVEYINGKEQSFMSKYTYDYFEHIYRKVKILPVTTRSMSQYNRINFPIKINNAVTTNGGIYLHNDQIKCVVTNNAITNLQLENIESQLKQIPNILSINYVDDIYLYAVCEDNIEAKKVSMNISHGSDIMIDTSGRKVYFIPKTCKKGSTLTKIKKSNNFDMIVAAGDSQLDVSMLNVADLAIIPSNLEGLVINRNTLVCPKNKLFSDFIINTILKI